jgi:RHS repeat-associated protein
MKRFFLLWTVLFASVADTLAGSCYVGAAINSEKYESVYMSPSLAYYDAFTYKGGWASGVDYEAGDYVDYSGKIFRANSSGRDQFPDVSGWTEVKPWTIKYLRQTEHSVANENMYSHWMPSDKVIESSYGADKTRASFMGQATCGGSGFGYYWDIYMGEGLVMNAQYRLVDCSSSAVSGGVVGYVAGVAVPGFDYGPIEPWGFDIEEWYPYEAHEDDYVLTVYPVTDNSKKTTYVYNYTERDADPQGEFVHHIDWTTTYDLADQDSVQAAMTRWKEGNPNSTWIFLGSGGSVREAAISYTENWSGFSFSSQAIRVTLEIKGCPGEYLVRYYLERRERGSSDPWVRDEQPVESQTSISEDSVCGTNEIEFIIPAGDGEEVRVSGPSYLGEQVYEVTLANGGPAMGQSCGTDLNSVHWQISAGFGNKGYSLGRLGIVTESLSSATYTPAALKYAKAKGVEVIYINTDEIRQILTPQGLFDATPLSVGEGFEVSIYKRGDVGAKNATTGIYALNSGATPETVWRIDNPDSSGSTRLRIAQTVGNTDEIYIYEYNSSTGVWALDQAGIAKEELTESISGTDRTVTRVVRDGVTNDLVSKTISVYRTYAWGEEQISEVLDPDSAALTTTWTFYDNSSTDGGAYMRLKSESRANGGWTRYYYDSEGRLTKRVSPWLDSLSATSSDSSHRVEEYTYTTSTVSSAAVEIEQAVEKILGNEISRRYLVKWVLPVTVGGKQYRKTLDVLATAQGAAWDASGNRVTETLRYATGDFKGRTWRTVNPDGTMTLNEYSIVYADDELVEKQVIWQGVPDVGLEAVTKGTRSESHINDAGTTIFSQTKDIESDLVLTESTAVELDDLGRAERINYIDGTFELFDYACCGLAGHTDREGIETTYQRDALKRVYRTTRAGIITENEFDAAERVTKVIRIGTDDTEMVQSESGFDIAGRESWAKDAGGRETTYAYSLTTAGGERRTTTHTADSSTIVEDSHRDGQRYTVCGTATAPSKTVYGATSGGLRWTQEIRIGESSSETEWVKTWQDFSGQTTKREYADSAEENMYYNAVGQLTKQTDADGVRTLFDYNDLGECIVTAIDMDRDDTIDYDGTDRVTRTTKEFVTKTVVGGDVVVERTITEVWKTDNVDTPTTVMVTERSVDGLQTWSTPYADDAITVHSITTYSSGAERSELTTIPGGAITLREYENGRIVSQISKDSEDVVLTETTFGYDEHGRLETQALTGVGTTTTTYYSDDQVHTVTTPDPDTTRSGEGYDAQVTTYTYNSRGWVSKVKHPDDAETETSYWPTGQIKRTWGARTYPVEYTYDTQGRMKTMTTWQDFAGTGGDAVTTWNYDSQRGWLNNKRYDDNKGPSYTYTDAGRLETRTWQRGIVTTYGYTNAGDLHTFTYSDSTPSVTHAYYRDGKPNTTTDAAGVLTRTYATTGELEDEVYTGSSTLLTGLSLEREYDALHRLESLSVPGATLVDYGYDDASRLKTITQGTRVATIGYKSNVGTVQTVTTAVSGTERVKHKRTTDNLGRVSQVDTTGNGTTLHASRTYTYNDANQRTRVEHEDDRRWAYGYDALGQVTSAEKRLSDDTTVLPGYTFAYTFDDIGNRLSTTVNGRTASYTPNTLNQYDERVVPGAVDVRGSASASVTVLVNDALATRTGDDFFKAVSVSNSLAPVNAAIKIQAVDVGPPEQVATENRTAFVQKTPEVFDYDDDGNLTVDGRWNYTWDGENRLVVMETVSSVATALPALKQRLEFAYDAQGRRIAKTVKAWNTGTSSWNVQADVRFLYDGWNMVGEYAASGHTPVQLPVWGLDVSGSAQGAGGVGGLLWVTDAAATYAPGYDGNGNAITWVNATTGALAGALEYGAFGESVLATGVGVTQSYGFSTKYLDRETGMNYYGLRYCNPYTGRWLNRDPAGEAGGINWYGMLTNDPVNKLDYLGLWSDTEHYDLIEKWLNSSEPQVKSGSTYKKYKWRCVEVDVGKHLKRGNDRIDGTGESTWYFPFAQSQANSYQHAMRAPNQEPEEARRLMYQFVAQKIQDARELASRARSAPNSNRIRIFIQDAVFQLGIAQHPLADQTSPEHKGFQVWWGLLTPPTWRLGLEHHNAETRAQYDAQSPAPYLAVKAAMQHYLDAILKE